ncbi:transmembrane amino acid transporter protein-domain-containing protein [Catenaria anguillulae PL171]|uniref:Transmembrane amino acid transporter protein-domain-containing protein n=1 Tax=Catenaria anguillulae PL171 TaxID=765915 RepID=A0A1Y2HLM5_9FUNG|nr:transmembrane amino acid transporter protein-domain-containing protein [Catenaria anguillulae PL171]
MQFDHQPHNPQSSSCEELEVSANSSVAPAVVLAVNPVLHQRAVPAASPAAASPVPSFACHQLQQARSFASSSAPASAPKIPIRSTYWLPRIIACVLVLVSSALDLGPKVQQPPLPLFHSHSHTAATAAHSRVISSNSHLTLVDQDIDAALNTIYTMARTELSSASSSNPPGSPARSAHSVSTAIFAADPNEPLPVSPTTTTARSDLLPKGTVFGGIINISNTILGSGMLAMPYAIATVGLGVGLGMVLFSGVAAAFGLWLLTHVARYLPGSESETCGGPRQPRAHSSFFSLSEITYPHAAVYFDAAIGIKCFGVASSYLVVIGDLMPEVMAGVLGEGARGSLWLSRTFWIVFAIGIVTPLSFAKQLNSLRHTSMVALGAVAYLVGIVIYFFVSPEYPLTPGEIEFVRLTPGFFKALPIFVFAFTCHQNIFAVYNEISDNSQSKLNVVISTSISAALVIYYVIGSLGYLMYGDSVAGNIIRMYPAIPLVTYGRLALAILFVFSYPIQAHPCRASIIKIVSYIHKQRQGQTSPTVAGTERQPLLLPVSPSYASVEQDDPRPLANPHPVNTLAPPASTAQAIGESSMTSAITVDTVDGTTTPPHWLLGDAMLHMTVTTCIITLSLLVALTVSSLDRVLSVVGATGSTTICYILPGLFYYKLYEKQPWNWVKVGSVGMTVTGVVIMVCCLTMQAVYH